MWDYGQLVLFAGETSIFDHLTVVVAENVSFERFRGMRPRSTFHVGLCSMSRFPAETCFFDILRLVVAENFILERFRAIGPRSIFHMGFCSMSYFAGEICMFHCLTSSSRKYCLRATASCEVEMDISCGTLLIDSLSSRNLHFPVPMTSSSWKCYFGAIPSYEAKIDILFGLLLNESLCSRNLHFFTG